MMRSARSGERGGAEEVRAPAPTTLGNAAAAHVRLIEWFVDCRHQVEPDAAEMAERYVARMARARLAGAQAGALRL